MKSPEESICKSIDVLGTEVVVQRNDFIKMPKKLTLHEYKILIWIISKIDPYEDKIPEFKISSTNFAKVLGLEKNQSTYKEMQNITQKLLSRVIQIPIPEREELIQTGIISYVHYYKTKGYLSIKLSEKLEPYFLHLKERFTQYKLSQITALHSVFALRIYELLKQNENIGTRHFFIDDLKKYLYLEGKFKSIKDFRIKVLDVAKKEINEKTDLKIDYNFQKSGRKFIAVEFLIESKDEKTEKKKADYTPTMRKYKKQIKTVQALGYTKTEAEDLLEGTYVDEAEKAINAVQKQIEKGNVKNPKAMLKTAIQEKWEENEEIELPTKPKAKMRPKGSKKSAKFSFIGFLKSFFYKK